MATTTANQGIRVPQSTDDPDVVDDLNKAVLDIEKKLVMSFANVSDRTTRVPSPVEGMLGWMRDTDTFVKFDGTAWANLVPVVPSFTSGTVVPSNTSGSDGDVFFKV